MCVCDAVISVFDFLHDEIFSIELFLSNDASCKINHIIAKLLLSPVY